MKFLKVSCLLIRVLKRKYATKPTPLVNDKTSPTTSCTVDRDTLRQLPPALLLPLTRRRSLWRRNPLLNHTSTLRLRHPHRIQRRTKTDRILRLTLFLAPDHRSLRRRQRRLVRLSLSPDDCVRRRLDADAVGWVGHGEGRDFNGTFWVFGLGGEVWLLWLLGLFGQLVLWKFRRGSWLWHVVSLAPGDVWLLASGHGRVPDD